MPPNWSGAEAMDPASGNADFSKCVRLCVGMVERQLWKRGFSAEVTHSYRNQSKMEVWLLLIARCQSITRFVSAACRDKHGYSEVLMGVLKQM